MKTREEYNRITAIRKWNANFNVPPVCTAKWEPDDWKRWENHKKPLPPFEEWVKASESGKCLV